MGFLSRFEGKMEDTVEGAAEKMSASPISPVQIAKKAEKQMRREKMVGAGKQYAPTLYTVFVSQDDDARLFGYYPTLAGETETYLAAKAAEHGLVMDGQPLVRFIADENLRHGKFDVLAEMVAAPIIAQLRREEMERYGIAAPQSPYGGRGHAGGYAQPGYDRRGAGYADDGYSQPGYVEPVVHQHAPVDIGAAAAASLGAAAAGSAEDDGDYYAEEPKTMMFGQVPGEDGAQAAPAQDLQAYIYDVTNDRAFTLTGQPMSIGRESRNDIVIPDINASRVHAEIHMEPTGAWILADRGSTNGTYVNGRKIKSTPVRDADRIIIGTTELEFQLL